jgi:hypothetical protein
LAHYGYYSAASAIILDVPITATILDIPIAAAVMTSITNAHKKLKYNLKP